MNEVSDQRFDEVKSEAKRYYDSIKTVRCPYLATDVHLSSFGFEHLLSKSWNRGRSRNEQYTRLRLLSKVVEIIKKSHTLQEYDERKMFVRQKTSAQWNQVLKYVRYYVFISVFPTHSVRLKIVVKCVEGGDLFLWSVYPSWKVIQNDDGAHKKVFYSGNLEED